MKSNRGTHIGSVGEPSATGARPSKTDSNDAPAQEWRDPDWPELVGALELKGAVRMLADNCAYLERVGGTIRLSLDSRSESTLTSARQKALAEALSKRFGEKLKVDIALDAHRDTPEKETRVERTSRENDERRAAARASLETDPNVKAMQDMFGAELKVDSIEPITPSSD